VTLFPLSLEPAAAEDFESLLALRLLVIRPDLERLNHFSPERARARFAAAFRPETCRLICLGGIRVGCIGVEPGQPDHEIKFFYIEPELQGRGIGGQVLRLIIAETEAVGAGLTLYALHGSAALPFYAAYGFSIAEELPFDYRLYRPCRPASAPAPSPLPGG
jgi:GNAT superfamily N-acetyltransferase